MNTLIIKNISTQLSYNDREELFRHFGAQSVTNRLNYSFAVFANEYKSREAMTRLHQLTVLGQRLRVEFAINDKTDAINQLPSLNEPHIQQRQKEESLEALKEVKLREFLNQLNYISPALGLNYLPSPLLRYRYPLATPHIVRRIGKVLLSHPRFYTQVLHLMNKMSLPVPFEPFDSSEDNTHVFDIRIPDINIDNNPKTNSKNDLSSDESELEISDSDINIQRLSTSALKLNKKVIKKLKTGFVGEKAIDLSEKFKSKRKQKQKSLETLPKIFDIPNICDQKPNISVNIFSDRQTLNQNKSNPKAVEKVSVQSSGFGLISSQTQKQSEVISEIIWDTNNIISDEEMASNRISMNQWPQYSVFRNYSCGQLSVRLYVKNIDKSVETKDLMRIYSKFIDWNSEDQKNMFDIRLMKTGRMKGQAFITLPNESIAQKALKETNGFLFNEKPIVVSYARSQRPQT